MFPHSLANYRVFRNQIHSLLATHRCLTRSEYLNRPTKQVPNYSPLQALAQHIRNFSSDLVVSNRAIDDYFPPSDENNDLILVRHLSEHFNEKKEHYTLHFDNDTLGLGHIELDCPQHLDDSRENAFRVIDSLNGLICLSGDLRTITHTIILWNPTIKKYVSLPEPHVTYNSHGPFAHVIGFGFDPKTDDYKVIRLTYLESYGFAWADKHPIVEVYSLRMGAWRRMEDIYPRCNVNYNSSQAFVNGAVHWIASNDRGSLILLFDMEKDEFREMNLPECLLKEDVHSMSIAILGESLAVFHRHGKKDWRTLSSLNSVWMMKNYGAEASWTKLLDIDLGDKIGMVLGLRRNGGVLLSRTDFLAMHDGEMVEYDPNTGCFRNLGLFGTANRFCVCSYVPSSVLLERANGVLEGQAENPNKGASSEKRVAEGNSDIAEFCYF